MMKKILFFALLLLAPCTSILADGIDLVLSIRYVDPTKPKDEDTGSGHKTPIRRPVISLSENTLTLNGAFSEGNLYIVNEYNVVVFSHVIDENSNEIVIPADIVGTYELQIVCGDFCYYCEIDLQ